MDYNYLNKNNYTHRKSKKRFPRKMILGLFIIAIIFTCLKFYNTVDNPASDVTIALSLPPENDDETPFVITSNAPVSNKAQKEQKVNKEPEETWHQVTIKSGDTLEGLLTKQQVSRQDIQNLLNTADIKSTLNQLQPGNQLEFKLLENQQLAQLNYQVSPGKSLVITRDETGYTAELTEQSLTTRQHLARGEITHSLYLAGQDANLPAKVTMQLAEIFAWQINFAKDIRPGDTFKVLYEQTYAGNEKIKTGSIVAAEFTNNGQTYRAIRYSPQDGRASYYSPEGKSLQRAFQRTPLQSYRISSHFDLNRKHPILNTLRPHYGVDLAANAGTPVKATSDGKIHFAGKKGGYGNVVIIDHGQHITTLYAHLKKVATGMKNGKAVKQGDVIGYVGSTGLASGPHLHYEFRIKNKPKNPMTVELPHHNAIPKSALAEFNQFAQTKLAELDGSLQPTQLAEAQRKDTETAG